MAIKKPTIWMLDVRKIARKLRGFELSFPGIYDYVKDRYEFSKKKSPTEEEKSGFHRINEAYINRVIDPYSINKPLHLEHLPTTMYSSSKVGKDVIFPDIFIINDGYLILSTKLAEIFQQFRTGITEIYPVRFYDLQLDEYVDNKFYYFINVCEAHHYFLPEKSEGSSMPYLKFSGPIDGHEYYHSPRDKEGCLEFAFSKDALHAPVDLWHDPWIYDSIFISDNLMKVIRDVGINNRSVPAFPCRLV